MLGLVVTVATLIYISINRIPKWRRVSFYVTDSLNAGMSFTAVEQGLVERYKLTPTQATLCVNHYGDIDWFEWQTFLEE